MTTELTVRENRTGHSPGTLLGVASRENNSLRSYLLVNRFQAKHVPVSPSHALALFAALGRELYRELGNKRVVFVGFAETATAIGAHVAACYPGESWYLHTTRESLDKDHLVVDFREEHSHASQQRLFCRDRAMLESAEAIVFVEDELTTGKTIRNFVQALEEQGIHRRFAAASIINCMEPEQREAFARRGISLHYLLSLENNFGGLPLDDHLPPPTSTQLPKGSLSPIHPIPGFADPRTGISTEAYRSACDAFAHRVKELTAPLPGERLLVLGTEECMYPAILCGKALEERGGQVRVHATTRSPILVGGATNPLESRVSLDSLYEQGRKTYLYNLDRYHRVIIVTDACPVQQAGLTQLAGALEQYGTNHITVMNWVK